MVETVHKFQVNRNTIKHYYSTARKLSIWSPDNIGGDTMTLRMRRRLIRRRNELEDKRHFEKYQQ